MSLTVVRNGGMHVWFLSWFSIGSSGDVVVAKIVDLKRALFRVDQVRRCGDTGSQVSIVMRPRAENVG